MNGDRRSTIYIGISFSLHGLQYPVTFLTRMVMKILRMADKIASGIRMKEKYQLAIPAICAIYAPFLRSCNRK